MANGRPNKRETGVLLSVLTAHYNGLVAARSDETVLRQYARLLRLLKSKNGSLEELVPSTHHRETHIQSPTLSENELRKCSLDDIDKLVKDEATARKDLEYIAIQRFSVPRGSIRSFSNRQMLVDKLRTLVANERTHETIGAVARGQGKRSVDK